MARGVWGPARSFVRWSLPSPTTRAGPPATGSGRSRPGFPFPDRHNPLDFVHRPRAGSERLRAVDGGACDRDPMASQSRVRIDDRVNEHAEGRAVPEGPGELTHPDDLAVRREEFHLHPHGPGSDGPASDKGFASRRDDLRENLCPLPSEVRRDPFDVRVEDFRQLLTGRLGSGGPEVPEGLDPPAAAFLVVPEVQVGPAADFLRRHAATDLHGPPSSQPYLRLIWHDRSRGPPWPPPHGFRWKPSWLGPGFRGRWTSSSSRSRRMSARSPPSSLPRDIGSLRRSCSAGTARTGVPSWDAGSWTSSAPAWMPAESPRWSLTANSGRRCTTCLSGNSG